MGSKKSTCDPKEKPTIGLPFACSNIDPQYCMTVQTTSGPIKVYYEHIRNNPATTSHFSGSLDRSVATRSVSDSEYISMQPIVLPSKPEEHFYEVPRTFSKK